MFVFSVAACFRGGATISLSYHRCTPTPLRTGQAAFPHPAPRRIIPKTDLAAGCPHRRCDGGDGCPSQLRLPPSPFPYPHQVSCHDSSVPCITFMFLLLRSIYREGLRSTRISRFIARPLRHSAPHHLQRGHEPLSLLYRTTYSGTDLAVASPRALHVARPVNYPSLFSSMQSGTPGCRFRTGHYRTHRMACALIERIGTTQNFIILGAMFQIQGIHPSPR